MSAAIRPNTVSTVDPLSDVYVPLYARGITAAMIGAFRIEDRPFYRDGVAHWKYPVYDLDGTARAWRLKAIGPARQKYRWMTDLAPAAADRLYLPLTVRPGKAVIVAAGEPDVWLLLSLGLAACSFLAGEHGGAPDTAVAELVARRPRQCVVLYDNDDAGREGCVPVVRALRAAGLDARAKRLPESLPEHGDLTDLYHACGRDRAHLVAAIRACPEVEIPPLPAHGLTPVRGGLPTLRAGAEELSIAEFKTRHPIATVVERVVPLRARQDGRYLIGRCPFHDDHTPSFVVWPDIDKWRCYGCGKRGDQIDFMNIYDATAPRGLTRVMNGQAASAAPGVPTRIDRGRAS